MSVIGTNISLTLRNVKGSELTYTELDNNQSNLKAGINNHSHDEFAPALGADDNYVTDAEKVKLSNLSGTNTGDQDLSGYSLTTHNHTGVYQPAGTYSTDIHSNITALNSVSGVNTGDQDLSGYSLATHNHTGTYEPANSNIQSHISSTSNPHNVTAAQTGADPVGTAAGLVSTHASSSDHDGRYYTETETNSLLSSKQNTSEKGQALGYCPLDGSAKVAESYLPDSVLGQVEYQGVWNATTNAPTIPAASSTNKGWYYIVSVSGTTAVDGIAEWTIGDWIISNGAAWTKIDNTDSVSSVFGRAGAIVANSGDYTASQVTNVPTGNIAAVTVQAALNELDTDKADASATTIALAGKENFHGIEAYGTIDFNDATQTLSVASITYWYKGTKFVSAVPVTKTITSPVADTLYFFQFDAADGVLSYATTPWNLKEDVLLATVAWNGSVGAVVRETHSHTRDLDWHENAHNTIGARYQAGLSLSLPSTTVDNQISIGSGTMWDEDQQINITTQTQARLWYRTATNYTFDSTPVTAPYKWNGSTSRVQYLDSDTGLLTDLGTSQYGVVWAYSTPDIDVPIWLIVGEHAAPYTTVANARAAIPPTLAGSAVTPEAKLLYRFIFRGDGQFQESADYRQSASLPAGGTASVSAAAVTFTPSGNIAATNVQAALEELDSEKASTTDSRFVTNGDSHDHVGGDGAAISLTSAVTGVLPIANGGTGSATQNFVDLTTDQTVGGYKSFTNMIATAGNVNFSGSGNRITGDFNNATFANRVMFQNNVTNALTSVGILPNGTSKIALLSAHSSSDPTDTATLSVGKYNNMSIIRSGVNGTGVLEPLAFQLATISHCLLSTNGNFLVKTAAAQADDDSSAKLQVFGGVLERGAGGIGYGSGSGGTVTQATSKSTSVTLNKLTGQITTASEALAAGATAWFTLVNSSISASDLVVVNVKGTNGYHQAGVQWSGAGQASLWIKNTDSASRSDAVDIKFAVIKGAIA